MAEGNNESNDVVMQCAGCGVKEGDDDIKLRNALLVRRQMPKGHRPKHKKECKKRAAELHSGVTSM